MDRHSWRIACLLLSNAFFLPFQRSKTLGTKLPIVVENVKLAMYQMHSFCHFNSSVQFLLAISTYSAFGHLHKILHSNMTKTQIIQKTYNIKYGKKRKEKEMQRKMEIKIEQKHFENTKKTQKTSMFI